MKKIIKKIFVLLFGPIVKRLGYVSAEEVLQSNLLHKNYLLNTIFTNLKTAGFNPKHIVDVGANHGTWTRETIKYFPEPFYTLIEPQNQ